MSIEQQPKQLIVVFDPIPYHGGSKVATASALCTAVTPSQVHVLSAHAPSWPAGFEVTPFGLPFGLAKQTQGIFYFAKQLMLLLRLALFCIGLCISHRTLSLRLVLASGPGVDMAGYWLAKLTKFEVIQFIHGPIGISRASRWALSQGHTTFYLESMQGNIKQALGTVDALPKNFSSFVNGLLDIDWPTSRFQDFSGRLGLFWAASLLKWKGLPLLESALQSLPKQSFDTTICYIKPHNTAAETAHLPQTIEHCQCFEAPSNLDHLRANSHIFVSTSSNEPFGLSVLEALAAGLIVVIPQDGAYWDSILTHGKECIKYRANDADSLADALSYIENHRRLLPGIALNGQATAERYTAERCYAEIAKVLTTASEAHSQAPQTSPLGDSK